MAGAERGGKEEKIIYEHGARVKGKDAPHPSSRASQLSIITLFPPLSAPATRLRIITSFPPLSATLG